VAVGVAAAVLAGCGGGGGAEAAGAGLGDRPVNVVATTNFIADLATEIGGDRAEVTALLGPGVDPHLYKASAGDVRTLRDADIIFYGGLDLEGRMSDLLVELASERATVAVTRDIPEDRLLTPSEFEGTFDPHVWFDVTLWQIAAQTVADAYIALDPDNAAGYQERADSYIAELAELDAYVTERVEMIPEDKRVLITSHDAFGYLGKRYGLDVEGIQGTSTNTEATTADIERVARLVADRGLGAVFIESSVPKQTIDAVLNTARRKGQEARIGGELYSDAAGEAGTPEGTYVGMVRHNIDLISAGLS
jgi:manganese/zinc/iron transport system substrate-binding protein